MFIQPHRDPPLHVVCSDCGDSHHVRHYPHRGVFGGDTDWICPKCVAKDDPPLSESIPGEMLLSEDSDQPPASALPVTVPAPLPSHVDSSAEFDAKMDVYGMERSPTQRNTKPDGNCAVYGNNYIYSSEPKILCLVVKPCPETNLIKDKIPVFGLDIVERQI